MTKPVRLKVLVLVVVVLCGVQCGWAMVNGNEVEIKRTTVPAVPEGSVGAFDLTGSDALVWRSGARSISVPYKTLSTFSYSNKLARHLGVLPAIGAGMVRKRERKHFFLFVWKDEHEVSQVLQVEVSKDAWRGLLEVMQARAPQACTPAGKECGIDRSGDD